MPTMHIFDCETGETTVREMTDDEAATHARVQDESQAFHDTLLADAQAAAEQRAADLATLAGDDPARQAALARLLAGGSTP